MADAAKQITRGALSAIFTDPEGAKARFPVPVLQCLQIKPLGSQQNSAGERYRVVLSDIDCYVQTMLATQANHVVHDGKLTRWCVVRITSYQANAVKGKNILIILGLEVVESLHCVEKIGEPVPFDSTTAVPAPTTIGGTGFYGVKKEEPASNSMKPAAVTLAKPAAAAAAAAGGPRIDALHPNLSPIDAISPYSHKWTIRARVTHKSDIRTWHKASGEGRLFSVNLLDESGEIKATAFNEQCDQFYDLLQEGAVYYLSTPLRVNFAKKQFNTLPHDYELMFERDTLVEKAEDQGNTPQVRYAFCNIRSLQAVEKDATVDLLGILREAQDVSTIISKASGKPFEKRELTVVDDSGFSVRVTIWGKAAVQFDAAPESVLAFKGLKVSDFNGRSLSLLQSGSMAVDPDMAEAHQLKGWYDSVGRADNFASHSNNSAALAGGAGGRPDQFKTIRQVRDENLGMDEQVYFTIKATVVFFRQETFSYPACSTPSCNRKVVEQGDGSWRCEACNVNHPQPLYRYTLSVNVDDYSGQLWLTCFDDVGRLLLGRPADDLVALQQQGDTAALGAEFEKANLRQYHFTVRARQDNFNDVQRIRYQVVRANAVDFKSDGHKLADMIKQFQL